MTALVVLLICMPAVIALISACFFMWRWFISRREASVKSTLLVGALGPFALFAPKAMTTESASHFRNFLRSAAVFIAYVCAVAVGVALISQA